jgi:hypothetical protein
MHPNDDERIPPLCQEVNAEEHYNNDGLMTIIEEDIVFNLNLNLIRLSVSGLQLRDVLGQGYN